MEWFVYLLVFCTLVHVCLQCLRVLLQSQANSVKEKTVSGLMTLGHDCCTWWCLHQTIHTHTHLHSYYTVRIYHRRGARRWKKVRRINGHAFVAKRFQMAFCDKCEDRIWGLGRQGYRCESCKMTVHKRCCYYLKQDEICKGHPVSWLRV